MQIRKLKLGQQNNNNKGSIKLGGANKKATLKCKKIIIIKFPFKRKAWQVYRVKYGRGRIW